MTARSDGSYIPPLKQGDRVQFYWDGTKTKYGQWGSQGNRPRLEDLQYQVGTVISMDFRGLEKGAQVYEVDVEFDRPIKVPKGKPIKTLYGLNSDHLTCI